MSLDLSRFDGLLDSLELRVRKGVAPPLLAEAAAAIRALRDEAARLRDGRIEADDPLAGHRPVSALMERSVAGIRSAALLALAGDLAPAA